MTIPCSVRLWLIGRVVQVVRNEIGKMEISNIDDARSPVSHAEK